jgi:hypothetical protein
MSDGWRQALRLAIEPEVQATKITVSAEVDRPLADVWRWYAIDHVRNHPRYPAIMEDLEGAETRRVVGPPLRGYG